MESGDIVEISYPQLQEDEAEEDDEPQADEEAAAEEEEMPARDKSTCSAS